MALTKNDFLWFNGARPMPQDLARWNWFELSYFTFLLTLYLVLTRGAGLEPNAARVQVREAAQGMLAKRRHQWQVWKRRWQSQLSSSQAQSVARYAPPHCMVPAFRLE